MKPEPLKDKELYNGIGKEINKFAKEDIKSAVEWLKDDIKSRDIPKGKKLILKLIDKAFEDVMK